jgi:signal transduction histidine kinase
MAFNEDGGILMQLRAKLMVSNILMAALPLLAVVLLVVAGMRIVGYNYIATLETLSENEDGLIPAQNVISAAKQEVLPGEGGGQIHEAALQRMVVTLEAMGFSTQVSAGQQMLISTLTPADETAIKQELGDGLSHIDNLSLDNEQALIIKNTFEENDVEYVFLAVNSGATAQNDQADEEVQYTGVWQFLPISVISVLAVLLVTNFALTVWISTSVLRPLKALQKGTREISEGNLDDALPYNRKDEFGQVCSDFDEMRKHLKQSVQTQLQYEQYRKELIAGISHDLRTPLTSIKGYVQGLKDGIADTPDKKARYFSAIETRTADLEALVDSLVSFSQMETGHYAFHFEKVDLSQWLVQYMEAIRIETEKRNQSIDFTCDVHPAWVKVDTMEMGRVLTNLLNNSAKHSDKQQSRVHISLTRTTDSSLRIEVKDDGPGVPLQDVNQIFESFYRGDAARTQPGKGSGLGLSIARQIVTAHGGEIKAVSGDGLTIIIDLPDYEEET